MATSADPVRTLLREVMALVRRASHRIYALLVIVLLGVVYAVVLPWFAVARRFRSPPRGGWQLRADPDVAAIERLRAPF